MLRPCFPHDNIVGGHLSGECMNSNELNVGHKLMSTWWLTRASFVHWQETCQVHQFVPSTGMSKRILWAYRWQCLQLIPVPLSWNGDHPSKDLTLWYNCSVCSVRQLAISLTAFLSIILPYRITKQPCLREVFPTLVNFQLLRQKFVIRIFLVLLQEQFRFGLHSRWVHPKYAWSRNEVGFVKIEQFFIHFFHIGSHCSASVQPFWCRPTCTDKNNPCFSMNE